MRAGSLETALETKEKYGETTYSGSRTSSKSSATYGTNEELWSA